MKTLYKLKFPLLFLFFSLLTLSTITAQTISAGTAHTAVICSRDSGVRAWGDNSNGQLGINDTMERNTPVFVHGPADSANLTDIKQIVIRENFSLALMYDGTVWAWGYNGDDQLGGQLGINSNTDSWYPVIVLGPNGSGYLTNVVQLAAGYAHVLALKSDGTVWAWGDNTNGELGNNAMTTDSSVVQVHGPGNSGFLTGITKIAAGQQFSLALASNGTVWAWGLDTNGALGDNSKIDQHTPVQVHGPGNTGFLTGIVDIAAGGGHALALRNDGAVFSWGFNINGELGDNTTNNSMVPEAVHGANNSGTLTNVMACKAGDYFSAVIMKDSTVWAWGFNGYGQLGQNDTNQSLIPVQVHGANNVGFLHGITEIALGDEHLIAKKFDGTYWSCGWNASGQLGDGTTTDRWTPVQVEDPCSMTLGVPTIAEESGLRIYPDPASTQVYFNTGNDQFSNLQIFNILGDEVYVSSTNNVNRQSVNVASFPEGVYFTRLTTNKGYIYGKFAVQR